MFATIEKVLIVSVGGVRVHDSNRPRIRLLSGHLHARVHDLNTLRARFQVMEDGT